MAKLKPYNLNNIKLKLSSKVGRRRKRARRHKVGAQRSTVRGTTRTADCTEAQPLVISNARKDNGDTSRLK